MKPYTFGFPTKEERTLLERNVGEDVSISFLLNGQEKEMSAKLTGIEEYGISFDGISRNPSHYALGYMPFSGARSCGILSVSQGGNVLYGTHRN